MPVNGFGVQCLETLCLSTDLVFRNWERCACQRIWRSKSENVVPVSGFGVQSSETLRFLANMMWGGWERCACQRIWCSESLFRVSLPVARGNCNHVNPSAIGTPGGWPV